MVGFFEDIVPFIVAAMGAIVTIIVAVGCVTKRKKPNPYHDNNRRPPAAAGANADAGAIAPQMLDTTGDGKADSALVDTYGDGVPDTIVKISMANLTGSGSPDRMFNLRRWHFKTRS